MQVPGEVLQGLVAPAPTDARRANALLCTPPKWGLRPHDPHGEGAPPLHPRGILQGRVPPAPTMQALRESMAKPCSAPG